MLNAHLQTIRWQQANCIVDIVYIDDNDEGPAKDLLHGFAEPADPKPKDALYEVGSDSHRWSIDTFHWLAQQKQRLLDHARTAGYDALFLVDTDLLLAPDTLSSLLNTRKDVVSAVFWTSWQSGAPPLPQVWLSHPYGLSNGRWMEHEFLGALAGRQLVQVHGLGACTLIRSDAYERVGFLPLLSDLPSHGMWQGEDRHFSIRAARNHIELWADAWPDVWHCYTPKQRQLIPDQLDRLLKSIRQKALFGDLVSFTVEPLEEPNLVDYMAHVRGRMGQLRLLPKLEEALLEMEVGEDRFLNLEFPSWYELEPYRGRSKLVRVKLLGARQYTSHPDVHGIAEPLLRNTHISTAKFDAVGTNERDPV